MERHEIQQRLVQIAESLEIAQEELIWKESRHGEILFGRGKAGVRAHRAYRELLETYKLLQEFNDAASNPPKPPTRKVKKIVGRRVQEVEVPIPASNFQNLMASGYPGVDECEAAGMDGTLRGLDGRPVGEPITWQELAQKLLSRGTYEQGHADGWRDGYEEGEL